MAVRWRTHWPGEPPSPRAAPASRTGEIGACNSRNGARRFPGTRRPCVRRSRVHVPAIVEAAIDTQPMNLDETTLGRPHEACRRRKVANTGRIDDCGRRAECVPARRGGGVPPLDVAGQLRGLRRGIRNQGIYQGGFADARLADQKRHAAGEAALELGQSRSRLSGHLDAVQVQAAIGLEFRLDGLYSQIQLIDDEQGVQVLQGSARPVAIDEEPIRCGFRGHHDGQPVDVGRYGLGTPARVDALDEIAAWLNGLDGRSIGRWRKRPGNAIAAHDALLAPR